MHRAPFFALLAFVAAAFASTVGFAASVTSGVAADALAVQTAPLRQGSELQVNVTTAGMQRSSDVAVGSDGVSMVVWSGDPREAGNDLDVYGRFYDAAGSPRGGEIRLNDNRLGTQSKVRVAAAPGGGYMAVWEDGGFITGRVYGADGQPLSNEIKVSAGRGPHVSPAMAATDGGFVVVWANGGGSPVTGDPGTMILGQRFSAQGSRVGASFTASDLGEYLSEPRVAASPGGGFIATWIEHDGLGETDVLAQRFDAASQPLGDKLRVNSAGSSRVPGQHQGAVPVVHADGSFSVLWTTSLLPHRAGTEGMFARRYSAAGAALSDVVEMRRGLFPQTPAAVLLPSGDVLVLWTEGGRPADPDGGILARLFDSSWTPHGSEFRINTFIPLSQTEPAVARDASGRVLAVWSSGLDVSQGTPPFPGWVDDSQDGSGFGVFAQRFTTATCAQTPNQLCLNGRFRVGVQLISPWSGDPEGGHALPLTIDTGAFWFFSEDNLELTIKVLDGRAVNGRFWVYAGALSDVAYTITITDTETGKVKTYHNDQGHLTSRADVEAF